MLRIGRLIISVAIDIVRKEADRLHEREKSSGIRQMFFLHGSQKSGRRLYIAFGESPEYVHVKLNLSYIRVIFRHCVGCRAQKIPIIGKHIARHYRVKVNHAKHAAVFVKHHVVDLCVAVADTLRKHALTMQTLSRAGIFHVAFHFFQYRTGFFGVHTSGRICSGGLPQLTCTQLHIMEIRYRLPKSIRDVGKHGLKFTEGLSRKI